MRALHDKRSRLAGLPGLKATSVPLLLVLCAGLPGCTTVAYYGQAVRGQLELLHRARPLDEAARDPALPAALRERLQRAGRIRDFASRQLGLPDNRSYRRYADLGRPYVAWNVIATPEFSTLPRQWCFPVAGCVGYRGYFAEAGAQAQARALRAEGLDTYVGGVPAYSTLGWFADPLPSTVMHYPEPDLARLVFHELAHQVAYVGGDTTFNESFATAVELEGVRRWIAAEGRPEQQGAFDAAQERRRAFIALVMGTRTALDALYAAPMDVAARRAAKAATFAALRRDYAALRARWGGYAGYDGWFAGELNNAQVASLALYTDLVPAFQALLERLHGDLPAFYAEVRRIAALPPDARGRALAGS